MNRVISDDLATKSDLLAAKMDLQNKIAIARRDTIIWLSGIMIVLLYGPIFIKYLATIIK